MDVDFEKVTAKIEGEAQAAAAPEREPTPATGLADSERQEQLREARRARMCARRRAY
jgi:hypothetical protein